MLSFLLRPTLPFSFFFLYFVFFCSLLAFSFQCDSSVQRMRVPVTRNYCLTIYSLSHPSSTPLPQPSSDKLLTFDLAAAPWPYTALLQLFQSFQLWYSNRRTQAFEIVKTMEFLGVSADTGKASSLSLCRYTCRTQWSRSLPLWHSRHPQALPPGNRKCAVHVCISSLSLGPSLSCCGV